MILTYKLNSDETKFTIKVFKNIYVQTNKLVD